MLTLEERERIAYITNAPEHPLIVLALEADEEQRDEIRDLEKTLADEEARSSEYSGKAEDLEIQVGDLEEKLEIAADTINDLNQRIHAAGVDLT